MIMGEAKTPPGSDPVPDAVGTTGLFLLVTAVIAFAVCMAGLTLARAGFAMTAALVTLFSFAGSMACFIAESSRLRESECARLGAAAERT
jgi:hypothetical protein